MHAHNNPDTQAITRLGTLGDSSQGSMHFWFRCNVLVLESNRENSETTRIAFPCVWLAYLSPEFPSVVGEALDNATYNVKAKLDLR